MRTCLQHEIEEAMRLRNKKQEAKRHRQQLAEQAIREERERQREKERVWLIAKKLINNAQSARELVSSHAQEFSFG
jgi:hypothetical protein